MKELKDLNEIRQKIYAMRAERKAWSARMKEYDRQYEARQQKRIFSTKLKGLITELATTLQARFNKLLGEK